MFNSNGSTKIIKKDGIDMKKKKKERVGCEYCGLGAGFHYKSCLMTDEGFKKFVINALKKLI